MKDLIQAFLAGVFGALTIAVLMGATGSLALLNEGVRFPDGTIQTTAAGARRSVYLTSASVQGPGALTACSEPGYHMASIWEISDPSRLDYAKDVSGAETFGDLGNGLPTGRHGWIRTGWAGASGIAAPGVGNCSGWAANAGFGTAAKLNEAWPDGSAGGEVPGWFFSARDCSGGSRVWCLQD